MKFSEGASGVPVSACLKLLVSILYLSGQLTTVICVRRSWHRLDTSGRGDPSEGRARDAEGHRYARQPRQGRLHGRGAVYDGHSRINSSESLSSSWFYQQDQPAILDQCCACDEAKYELVFEGLWSKYTHPDDFPENYWLAYFSDIIGASHSNDFQMWAKDSLASDGVRELAEMGSTKKLESELKHVSSKTRTIIKARELRYPTLNSKTSAVFRTDKHHHLVSILSKLGPSPDWMVGVSGLELCQLDCSWAAQRVVNLYLWDAGTDSGNSFTSSDQPTQPQERVHPYQRRTSAAAGYSVSGLLDAGSQRSALEPYGQLMNGDTSVYAAGTQQSNQNQRSTNEGQGRPSNDQSVLLPLVDDVGPPSSSSGAYQAGGNQAMNNYRGGPASANMQQDQVKPFARLTVTRQRIYEKSCNGNSVGSGGSHDQTATTVSRPSSFSQLNHHNHHLHPTINSDALIEPISKPNYLDCRFTDWSDWSSCSSNCGKGIRTRTRSFLDEQAHLAGCSQSDLIEKEICLAECVGNTSCVTRDWSEWSKCSVNCGQGYRKRTRSPIGNLKQACASIELVEMEQCAGECNEPSRDNQPQPGARSHCAVTEWSQWSECSVACGKGTKIRTRQFIRKEEVENCGHVKLLQKQACNGRPELCKQVASKNHMQNGQPLSHNHHQQSQYQNQKQTNYNLPVIDCKLSGWSPWSTCSALCGSGRRTRSRYIIQMPQNGGKPCDKKLSRTQRCKDLPPCPQDYVNNQDSDSNGNGNNDGSGGGGGTGGKNGKANQHQTPLGLSPVGLGYYRTTTTTTTPGSSMMDDEDDSKFSRSLKAELNHLQLSSWTPSISYISDGVATSTEMELIGSSSFHIRNGYVYPFGELET